MHFNWKSVVALGVALSCSSALGSDVEWQGTVSSLWSDGDNWSSGSAPGSDEAILLYDLGDGANYTLDVVGVSYDVFDILIDSSTSYLIKDLVGGAAFSTSLFVVAGGSGHELAVDVSIGSSTTFATVGGSFWTVSGDISGSGGMILKNSDFSATEAGTVVFTGAVGHAGGTELDPYANLQIGDGGTLISANGLTLDSGDTLSGIGTVETGSTAATAFVNNGTVDGTGSGTGEVLEFTGYVKGAGAFEGDVTFSGTFAPGNSPGMVTLENFTLSSTSTLVIELAATTQGVTYDFLDISGTATLQGGTLSVVLLDGFVPSYGDAFTFVDADGGISGDFGGFDLPTLSNGLSWSVTNDGTAYSLTAVPEPAGVGWVMGLGAVLLVCSRLRRNEGSFSAWAESWVERGSPCRGRWPSFASMIWPSPRSRSRAGRADFS